MVAMPLAPVRARRCIEQFRSSPRQRDGIADIGFVTNAVRSFPPGSSVAPRTLLDDATTRIFRRAADLARRRGGRARARIGEKAAANSVLVATSCLSRRRKGMSWPDRVEMRPRVSRPRLRQPGPRVFAAAGSRSRRRPRQTWSRKSSTSAPRSGKALPAWRSRRGGCRVG